jgi:hypothetical protein
MALKLAYITHEIVFDLNGLGCESVFVFLFMHRYMVN